MQFQLNTDANIAGDDTQAAMVEDVVTSALGHLADRLTRVEVYLADANAAKGGADDISCKVEARPEGLPPQVASHADADVVAAVRGASKKLRAALDSQFGKLARR